MKFYYVEVEYARESNGGFPGAMFLRKFLGKFLGKFLTQLLRKSFKQTLKMNRRERSILLFYLEQVN